MHVHDLVGSLAWANDQAGHGLARSSPHGAGWASPKKINPSKKFVIFWKKNYCILISIGLYFYIVNIQIRY